MIQVYNEQYKEMYDFPDETVREGVSLAEAVRARAERGDFGPGDPEELIEQRVQGYIERMTLRHEEELPNGRVIELLRTPVEGGGVVGIATDITDRKLAETALRESEERAKAILNTAFQLQGLLKPDGTLIEANAAALSMSDASRDDVVGMPFWDCPWWANNPDLQIRLRETVKQAARGETVQFLAEHPTLDGSVRSIDFRMTPVRDENGDVILLVPEGHDITELKRAEQKLAEAFDVITSSINYATHIQRSLLPPPESLSAGLPHHFILWEPRDHVGGDIYFFKPWGLGRLLALVDCTGHGVPGAFMTMIANGALDMAIMECPPGGVAVLLQRTHQLIQASLGQDQDSGASDDGLEMGICYIAPGKHEMVFSGARFSLFYVEDGEVFEVKGDRTGIGYRGIPKNASFTDHSIDIGNGRSFYMTSDGLIDQVGGEKRRSYGKRRFMELLSGMATLPMNERRDRIRDALEDFQADQRRRDDVSVIGFAFDDDGSVA
jgi:PAS domain S-box-containing protein